MTQPKLRISARLKTAIEGMVELGLTRDKAAERAEITDHALYCALRKPHVAAYRTALMGVLRTSAASRTIAHAERLMDGAQSEHVRLEAAKWLAEIGGIRPEADHGGYPLRGSLVLPGLTIILGGGKEPAVIEGTARVVQGDSATPKLPTPVPHPALSDLDDGAPRAFATHSNGRSAPVPHPTEAVALRRRTDKEDQS